MIFRRGYRFLAGVAFEQGKFLPTPETVPFRLTRDMVDGMGLTGVEGVYRRCCEKTMEVMRTSQESLMTVVEVRCANKRSVSCMHSHVLDQKEGESIKRSFSEQRRPTPVSAWHLTQKGLSLLLACTHARLHFCILFEKSRKKSSGFSYSPHNDLNLQGWVLAILWRMANRLPDLLKSDSWKYSNQQTQ